MNLPRIAIATGDPAGIGPEIALKAALDARVRALCRPLLVGDPAAVELHTKAAGLTPRLNVVAKAADADWSDGVVNLLDAGDGEYLQGIAKCSGFLGLTDEQNFTVLNARLDANGADARDSDNRIMNDRNSTGQGRPAIHLNEVGSSGQKVKGDMSSLSFKDGLCLAKVLVEIAKVGEILFGEQKGREARSEVVDARLRLVGKFETCFEREQVPRCGC